MASTTTQPIQTGKATGLWSQLTKDVQRAVSGVIDRRSVVSISDTGKITATSSDPFDPDSHAVSRLRNIRIQPGDDVLTVRIGGGELVIGVIPKPGQVDDPAPAYVTDLAAKRNVADFVPALLAADRNTTSTTASSISGFTFPIGPNEKWIVDFVLGTGCSGAGGIKFQAAAPSGASVQLSGLGSGAAQSTLIVNNTGTGLTPAFNTAVFYNGVVRFTGVFKNGSVPGVVQMMSAAGTAGQTATVYTDSSMRAQKVS